MIYKFTLEKDTEIMTELKGHNFVCEWFRLFEGGKIIIKKGYSWDGCSPKVKIFGKIIGTWDGKNNSTYYASMLHDVLYQYKREIPFSRLEVDKQFKKDLEKINFKYTNIYYFFVRKFGGMYGKWKIK